MTRPSTLPTAPAAIHGKTSSTLYFWRVPRRVEVEDTTLEAKHGVHPTSEADQHHQDSKLQRLARTGAHSRSEAQSFVHMEVVARHLAVLDMQVTLSRCNRTGWWWRCRPCMRVCGRRLHDTRLGPSTTRICLGHQCHDRLPELHSLTDRDSAGAVDSLSVD